MAETSAQPAPVLQEALARFREEWKKEVQEKKTHAHPTQGPPALSEPQAPVAESSSKAVAHHRRKSSANLEAYVRAPARPRHFVSGPDVPGSIASNLMNKAVTIYKEAVTAESQGDMDRAIELYRHSFRVDANVDKAYQRIMLSQPKPPLSPERARHAELSFHHHTSAKATLAGHADQPTLKAHTYATLCHFLASLPEPWPPHLDFQPEDEMAPVPLNTLPDELLVLVLCELANLRDVMSIERFAQVNRKARLVSLDGAIWRELVNLTYVPPQIAEDASVQEVVEERYEMNCRSMYIMHPRVRLDGVYIAVCHYVRAGHSESNWVNVTHVITYHRYLRFLADGTVLSLLTNDELRPSEVVSQLKPSLRLEGFYIGTWYLDGSTVYIKDLLDPSGRFARYGFEMTLKLRSKPAGRWNRLEIEEYVSIQLETAEATPLVLKHDKPFWFSKVRSYEKDL